MLPSKGYFSVLNCPYFDSDTCERPHCHFRHVKKDKSEEKSSDELEKEVASEMLSQSQPESENLLKHLVTVAVAQVLSHTEVREKAESSSLNQSAIVSEVVSDVVSDVVSGVVSKLKSPVGNIDALSCVTYKPTPISELKRRHIPVMYAPEKPIVAVRKRKKSQNHIADNNKYVPKPSDSFSGTTAVYNPSSVANDLKEEYTPGENTSDVSYTPSKIEGIHETSDVEQNLIESREGKQEGCVTSAEHISKDTFLCIPNFSYEPNLDKEDLGSWLKSPEQENEDNSTAQDIFVNAHCGTEISENECVSKGISNITQRDVKICDSKEKEEKKEKHKVKKHENKQSNEKKKTESSHTPSLKHKSKHKDDKSKSHKHGKSEDHSKHSSKSKSHKSRHHHKKREKSPDPKLKKSEKSHRKGSKPSDEKNSKTVVKRKNCDSVQTGRKKIKLHNESHSASPDTLEIIEPDVPVVIVDSSPERNTEHDSLDEDLMESSLEHTNFVEPQTKKRVAHKGAMSTPSLSSAHPKYIDPEKTVCERWLKARQGLLKPTHTQGKVRISSVPNVSSILNAKDALLRTASTSCVSKKDEDIMTPKLVKRIAHTPSLDITSRPLVEMDDEVKVPFTIRQACLNNMFDEYAKYIDAETARAKATQEEKEICSRVKVSKTYQNAMALAVLRIRKTKGKTVDQSCGKPPERLTSSSSPSFTYGVCLYECFAKYLLSELDIVNNGFPIELPNKPGCGYIEKAARWKKTSSAPCVTSSNQRVCCNCSKWYYVDDDGIPVTENDCTYHWARTYRTKIRGNWTDKYGCCDAEIGSEPCTTSRYHVCDLFDEDCLEGFVTTREVELKNDTEAGIYGLDCEMSYTVRGLEVTRCTLVNLNGETVYDKMVLPDFPILDYCTRFSGVTEETMREATLSLPDIQEELLQKINSKTILVGHSLENDLKALRIFHKSIVDTSVVFPHKMGPPKKRALRKLVEDFLRQTIQNKDTGHDSSEDARACINLMIWKVKEDAKARKPRVILSINNK